MRMPLWAMGIMSLFISLNTTQSYSQEGSKRERIAVMVFAQGGIDERLRTTLERDLRNMVVAAEARPQFNGRLYPVEVVFDVGQRRKSMVDSAKRHFNNAQRAFEAGDFDEAKDQVMRADRFYKKGIPFIYQGNEELLQSIYYLNFLTFRELKAKKKTRDLYCTYVSLARNITGSVGLIDQFDSLAEMCEDSPISGTAELKVSSKVDGAHVFIDSEPVGIVDRKTPFIKPFLPSGVHLVEVRKLGYARWGKLVLLENGRSKSMKARLKRAKNRSKDYQPLASLKVAGPDAYSDEFLNHFLYNLSLRFRVSTLILAYLNPTKDPGVVQLNLISFRDEMLSTKLKTTFKADLRSAYFPALTEFWSKLFGFELQPQEMRATQSRWMPTFFKVE